MGPEFGIGIEHKTSEAVAPRPRPSLFVRGIEMFGLAMVAYGLGTYRFGHAAVGGVLIIGSYALYRRKHGPYPPGVSQDGPGSNIDGGFS
jgi:hypothetical protein